MPWLSFLAVGSGAAVGAWSRWGLGSLLNPTPAQKAFEQCLDMAKCFGAELSIVSVVRPPEFAEDVETKAILENAHSHFDAELATLRSRASAQGLLGSVSRLVIAYARCAVIVIR